MSYVLDKIIANMGRWFLTFLYINTSESSDFLVGIHETIALKLLYHLLCKGKLVSM